MKDVVPDSWIMGEHIYQRMCDESAQYDPRVECPSCLNKVIELCHICGESCEECHRDGFKPKDCEGEFNETERS